VLFKGNILLLFSRDKVLKKIFMYQRDKDGTKLQRIALQEYILFYSCMKNIKLVK